MIKTIAWHLSGFVIFGLISWGLLTLLLMMPDQKYWWAAWAVAGSIIVRVILAFGAIVSGYLACYWLFNPADLGE